MCSVQLLPFHVIRLQEALISDAMGKDATFLLRKSSAEKLPDGEVATINDAIVEALLSARAKYLLTVIQAMIQIPDTRGDNPKNEKSPKLVQFDDLDADGARVFHDVASYLTNKCKESQDYIVELEARFLTQTPNPQTPETSGSESVPWINMWVEVFEKAINTHRKLKAAEAKDASAKGRGAGAGNVDPAKLLPPPKAIISLSLLKGQQAQGANKGQTVKEEQDGAKGAENSLHDEEVESNLAYFQNIYTSFTAADYGSAGKKTRDFHMMDVLAVQSAVEQHITRRAALLRRMFFLFYEPQDFKCMCVCIVAVCMMSLHALADMFAKERIVSVTLAGDLR